MLIDSIAHPLSAKAILWQAGFNPDGTVREGKSPLETDMLLLIQAGTFKSMYASLRVTYSDMYRNHDSSPIASLKLEPSVQITWPYSGFEVKAETCKLSFKVTKVTHLIQTLVF